MKILLLLPILFLASCSGWSVSEIDVTTPKGTFGFKAPVIEPTK